MSFKGYWPLKMPGPRYAYNAVTANQTELTAHDAPCLRKGLTDRLIVGPICQVAENRGPNRMMLAPITHNATPSQSEPSGRIRSTTANQPIDAMM